MLNGGNIPLTGYKILHFCKVFTGRQRVLNAFSLAGQKSWTLPKKLVGLELDDLQGPSQCTLFCDSMAERALMT